MNALARRRLLRVSQHLPNTPSTSNAVRRLHVAVVGSGPAGFYFATTLLRTVPTARITLVDASPVPFGLVRYGVAPDHPDVKNCIRQFTELVAANSTRLTFMGNVRVGEDVCVDELRRCVDAVVLAYGAGGERTMGVKGESAKNCVSARRFVGWYNGVPADQELAVDLESHDTCAIIGQGNVAIDVARILLTHVDVLRTTDTTEAALQALSTSRIKHVHLIGRRGPLQVAFTIKEFREILKLPNVRTTLSADGFDVINDELITRLPRSRRRLIELLLKVSRDQSSTGALLDSKTTRTAHFDFLRSPSTVLTDTNNRVVGVELEKNRMNTKLENVNPAELHKITAVGTNVKERLDCGLLFVSIGYRSMAIDGLPFDAKRNLIPTNPIDGHSVLQIDGTTNSRLPGVYAVGWCARGATGVIADTQMEARRCAQVVADDYTNGKLPNLHVDENASQLERLLQSKNVRRVSWPDWLRIDAVERQRGSVAGKPREKLTNTNSMMQVVYGGDNYLKQ